MQASVMERTNLWQRTLGSKSDDLNGAYRDELRVALLQMRDNVIPFVRNIHKEVLGLTVHDESHLDALWETADVISGDEFDINPLEAFIFGCSVLIHDTAMTVAAYSGGLDELKNLDIWKDIEKSSPYDLSENDILFRVLRELHAEQAEKLIGMSFRKKGSQDNIFLLESVKLRDALGKVIGRIAHSHHWDIAQVASKLNSVSGGVPGYPSDWTVNEVKIAALLRCADAAHIDSRRAPTLLYAISKIGGVSDFHWTFQNKLNAVTRKSDKLVFTSGSDFYLSESTSWWMAFDIIQMIDRELKNCASILEGCSSEIFAATSVSGSESPLLLSKLVRVDGWVPVDAQVKVSNPVGLARTLGGQNLYGRDVVAPLRELLQNSADAIRIRRTLESRKSGWGRIRITIEQDKVDPDARWLHVDDEGIGMSEWVLTGPLIDFGSSLWSASELREEFPGLKGAAKGVIGKFGIGFFSVFLLGDLVRVITRRYDAGTADAKVLAFERLSKRPVLRSAVTGELPVDFSTRVSVLLSDESIDQLHSPGNPEITGMARRLVSTNRRIRSLVSAVDIDIEFRDIPKNIHWKHCWNWDTVNPREFLTELTGGDEDSLSDHLLDRVRVLKSPDGCVFGRGVIPINSKNSNIEVSVGGFVGGFGRRFDERDLTAFASGAGVRLPPIIGVISGDTSDASRRGAVHNVPAEVLVRWANEQASLIDSSAYLDSDLISICHSLMQIGATCDNLPWCYLGGKFVDWSKLVEVVASYGEIFIPIYISEYSDNIEFSEPSKTAAIYWSSHVKENICITNFVERSGSILSKRQIQKVKETRDYLFSKEEVASCSRIYAFSSIFKLLSNSLDDIVVKCCIIDILKNGSYSGPEMRSVICIKRAE